VNITGLITETENDNAELPETCSACGNPIEDGEGRFRKTDGVYCVECCQGGDTHDKTKKSAVGYPS
jgi:hypothetical protein